MLAFAWNIFCCLMTICLPWHLLLGTFDVAITVALGVSHAELYTFIPRSNSTCNNDITIWNLPAGGEPNIFVVAANLTSETPQIICNRMVGATTWQAVIL